MNRRRMMATVLAGNTIADNYYLYDTFATDRAAGAVIGSAVDGVGGVRAGRDTNGRLSISGGNAVWGAGTAANEQDPALWYAARSRAVGLPLIAYLNGITAATQGLGIGWDTDQLTSAPDYMRMNVNDSSLNIRSNNGTSFVVGTIAAATAYKLAGIARVSGYFWFIQGGAFTNWTFIYATQGQTAATIYPTIGTVFNGQGSFSVIKVPKQTYIPAPLQSDGMSNSLTDGLGNPENNGPIGTTYEDFGTWGVAGGVRSCSVLGGATGSSVLATSTKNVHIEVNVVRSAGFGGITARRADSSNYIRCTHDGTNVVVTQLIAGTPTVLSTTAVAYSASATLKFDLLGTAYRAIYNNTAGGTGTVTDTESTNHGLITSGTANTFDNLVIWGKTGYEGLNVL